MTWLFICRLLYFLHLFVISGVDKQGAYGAYAPPVTKMHNIFKQDSAEEEDI